MRQKKSYRKDIILEKKTNSPFLPAFEKREKGEHEPQPNLPINRRRLAHRPITVTHLVICKYLWAGRAGRGGGLASTYATLFTLKTEQERHAIQRMQYSGRSCNDFRTDNCGKAFSLAACRRGGRVLVPASAFASVNVCEYVRVCICLSMGVYVCL